MIMEAPEAAPFSLEDARVKPEHDALYARAACSVRVRWTTPIASTAKPSA